MPVERLKKYLNDNNIRFVIIVHSPAYTAQEIAASAHIPGQDLAKTVMVKIDGKMAMAVLPASYGVDLDLLKNASGGQKVALASEAEFKDLFPDCELGAMPPFGNLWDLPVYVAKSLSEDKEIAFLAGSHGELIRLSFDTYTQLTEPTIARISYRR